MSAVDRLEPFAAERFLDDYWQRRACLIRGWLQPEPLPLATMLAVADAHELPSRLITGSQRRADWTLTHGPISPSDLPGSDHDWTVLVQEMDKATAAAAAILDPFRTFLPDWIIDDVMISQAAPGGSVGAHVDAYDVFLIQVAGRRRWQLAIEFDPTPDHRFEMALLQHWQPETELIARPGDVLYLPAGIAHHGIAEDDCQTWSVGLRTPSAPELLFHLAEAQSMGGDQWPRLDIGRPDPEAPASITPQQMANARQLIERAVNLDDAELASLLGRVLTSWRLWQRDDASGEFDAVHHALGRGDTLMLDPATRLAVTESGGRPQLYVNGEPLACPQSLARELAATRQLSRAWLDHPEALQQLYELGAL